METWGERRKRARGFYIDLLCSALWNGASFAEYVQLNPLNLVNLKFSLIWNDELVKLKLRSLFFFSWVKISKSLFFESQFQQILIVVSLYMYKTRDLTLLICVWNHIIFYPYYLNSTLLKIQISGSKILLSRNIHLT